jgi:ParB-like chromosome segregation protein Spo0J
MPKKIKINTLIKNDTNPRFIRDNQFKKLVKSIKEFPEMLEKRPIVVDENMIVLGGNMRLRACKEAGLKDVWIDQVTNWTENQKREFIIKDNVGFGEWDWDILGNNYSFDELKEWGLDTLMYEDEPDDNELAEDFKEKDAKIIITFENVTDLQKAEIDIQEILDRKYPKAYFSVNGGVL